MFDAETNLNFVEDEDWASLAENATNPTIAKAGHANVQDMVLAKYQPEPPNHCFLENTWVVVPLFPFKFNKQMVPIRSPTISNP